MKKNIILLSIFFLLPASYIRADSLFDKGVNFVLNHLEREKINCDREWSHQQYCNNPWSKQYSQQYKEYIDKKAGIELLRYITILLSKCVKAILPPASKKTNYRYSGPQPNWSYQYQYRPSGSNSRYQSNYTNSNYQQKKSRRTPQKSSSDQKVNFYTTLEIPRNATEAQIKKAFRKLALKWHPDKNNGSLATANTFKKINEAYQTLGDPVKKRIYDLTLPLA